VEEDGQTLEITDPDMVAHKLKGATRFRFDQVLEPASTTQATLYWNHILPLKEHVIGGYNVTVLAYGVSGAGKTHTLTGQIQDEEERGLVPRLIQDLCQEREDRLALCEAEGTEPPRLKLQVLEIYQEKLNDLLGDQENLPLRTRGHSVYVEGAVSHELTSVSQGLKLIQSAHERRHVQATALNDRSSRGHSLTILEWHWERLKGALYLVDLAGAENVQQSRVQGQALKEASAINKSLSELTTVITALGDRAPHIPYRNSKLTHLLQESLGGNSLTLVILACAPERLSASTTWATFRFGQRIKKVKTKPKVNRVFTPGEYQKVMESLKSKYETRDARLQSLISETDELERQLEALLQQEAQGSDGEPEAASPERHPWRELPEPLELQLSEEQQDFLETAEAELFATHRTKPPRLDEDAHAEDEDPPSVSNLVPLQAVAEELPASDQMVAVTFFPQPQPQAPTVLPWEPVGPPQSAAAPAADRAETPSSQTSESSWVGWVVAAVLWCLAAALLGWSWYRRPSRFAWSYWGGRAALTLLLAAGGVAAVVCL